MLVVPREGAATVLHVLLSHALTPEALMLKLFTNNLWPALTDTAESFQEADFFGYAPIRLEPARWMISADAPVSAPDTVAEHRPQVFVPTARQLATHLLYGYYLVGAMSARCYWAERFTDGPYVIVSVPAEDRPATIRITPRITCLPAAETQTERSVP